MQAGLAVSKTYRRVTVASVLKIPAGSDTKALLFKDLPQNHSHGAQQHQHQTKKLQRQVGQSYIHLNVVSELKMLGARVVKALLSKCLPQSHSHGGEQHQKQLQRQVWRFQTYRCVTLVSE